MAGFLLFSASFYLLFSLGFHIVRCSTSDSRLSSWDAGEMDDFQIGSNIMNRQKLTLDANDAPEIVFEDSGSFHLRVKCLGKEVTSLSALQCDSPIECQQLVPCFEPNNMNFSCLATQIIYRGEKCASSNTSSLDTDEESDCFVLEDRQWRLSSGLIECSRKNGVSDSSQTVIEQFFKGTDQFFHLVKSKNFQLSLAVRETPQNIVPIEYIEYAGKPVFYTNKPLRVHCRATKFLFSGIFITLGRSDGSTRQIDSNATLPGDQDKYWERFYWEAFIPGIEVTPDMTSLTCHGQHNDGSEWTLVTLDFTAKEPSTPRIDKTKAKQRILWGLNDEDGKKQEPFVACNYTGGPASVEFTRDQDGHNLVDRYIISYDDGVRERRRFLDKNVYEGQEGNYSCSVANEFGNDSFTFYVDFPKNQGQCPSVNCIGLCLSLILFLLMWSTY